MNKKVLLSSLMSVAMLASIASGATYALFTAEDKVNVNVTAGKVSVTANVRETFKIKSLDTELKEVSGKGTFSTGGTVIVDEEGNIALDRIVPGDKVEFFVDVKNDSTVKVNFRSIVAVTEGLDLFSGLKVTIDDKEFDGMTAYSNWELLNPGEGNKAVKVTIELPEEAKNEFQNKSTKIQFTVSALQGNAEVANEDANTTLIYSENDFRLFAMNVNRGNSYKGKTVKLMAPIDLENREWTPIGTAKNTFKGTFDGQNKKISNLNIGSDEVKNDNVGLFGYTTEGAIKNVHVENADVDGRVAVGVVAGVPYTSTYTNIKVTGNVKVDGLSYVGGALGRNIYANVTNVTIDATEGSYVSAYSYENGSAYRAYVGGVFGFVAEGSHVISNVTSNIDVLGTICDVGGLTGIAHFGTTFVNCYVNADVTLLADAEDLALATEVGGLAGVWHNAADVTFIDCAHNGDVKVLLDGSEYDVVLANDGLVGSAYSSTGTGNLIFKQPTVTSNVATVRESLASNDGFVKLDADVTCDAVKGGYSVAGLTVTAGRILDGNGKTLTVNNANDTYGSAIYATGGTIKNLTVAGAFRGIFMAGGSGDLLIENVTIKDVVYTFNSDAGNKDYSVTIKNSTLNGWTSYSNAHKLVTFENCNFGEGNGYAFCRPYNKSVFTNCNFEEGFTMDARAAVTLENCYLNGVRITADNFQQLVTSNAANVTVK